MKKIYIILLSLALISCDKIAALKDLMEALETRVTIFDPTSGQLISGFAADGGSVIEIKVSFNSDENPISIAIAPEGEAYGLLSTSQEAFTQSSISYELTTEDIERGYALFYLLSDEDLPSSLATTSSATISYDVTITVESDEEVSRSFDVEVVRPPVIFAHGFASSDITYDPMLSYITPKGLYIDSGLYVLDYMLTSLASYEVNKTVISDAIDQTKSAMLAEGYIFKKAVVVGHSMGGVLTRLYMQSSYGVDYRDDILKIITIDSPFSGTQLANFGIGLADKYPDSPLKLVYKMGAIIDFQVDSEATLNVLNGESLNKVILPTHILSATFGDTKSIVGLISDGQYVQALLSFLVQKVATEYIYGEDNDLIVPHSSQIGGIEESLLKDYVTTYSGEWHCSVHTTEAAANDIMELLDTPSTNGKKFSTAGFNPSFLSYDATSHTSVTMVEKSSSEIASLVTSLITIGLDADGDIVDMGYESADDNESITIENSSVVETYTIGVSTTESSTLFFSL
ncbi:MAG: alpha/beta hydrolase [Rikenellaceae bacterium]